jgi:hypothetical protein
MLSPVLPPLFWEFIPFEVDDSAPTRPYKGCVGHFWDSVNRKRVTVRMGNIYARPVLAFRSAPSVVNNLVPFVGIEGADQSAKKSCSVSTTATNSHN